jgi:CRISPR/Cas system CSM-associated protein Csm2 small subunit
MDIIKKLGQICKDIKELEDASLLDKALCAYAAISNKDKTNIELSYTSVMRELRKNQTQNVRKFQEKFKEVFEKALDEDLEDPEEIALTSALKYIHWK